MVIFHSYVKLPEGITAQNVREDVDSWTLQVPKSPPNPYANHGAGIFINICPKNHPVM